MDYNFWHCVGASCVNGGEELDDNYEGTNFVKGDPKLFKQSDWVSLPSTPSMSDLAVLINSDLEDNATNLGALFDDIIDTNNSSFASDPISLTLVDQDDYGSGWDFGALLSTVKNAYVRPHVTDAECTYGNCDGSNYANAWEGVHGGNGTPMCDNTYDCSGLEAVDAGNGTLFICGTHREEFWVQSEHSGEDGTPLQLVSCEQQYGADVPADDPGIIYASERKNYTDWELWWTSGDGTSNPNCNASGERCIYRTAPGTMSYRGDDYTAYNLYTAFRSTDGGTTWARNKIPNISIMGQWNEAAIISNLGVNDDDVDLTFYGRMLGENPVHGYFRCDYHASPTGKQCGASIPGTPHTAPATLGTWEVPQRTSGILVVDDSTSDQPIDYVTIKGLTFKFWGASLHGGSHPAATMTLGSTGFTVQNNTFEYGIDTAVHGLGNNKEHDDWLIEDNVIRYTTSGVIIGGEWGPHDDGPWKNDGFTFRNNHLDEIGTVHGDDFIDIELIGMRAVSDVLIHGNYFGSHGWDCVWDYGDYGHCVKNAIAFIGGRNIELSNNYFYKCGTNCIGFGASNDDVDGGHNTQNVTIRANVFDSWAYNTDSDLNNNNTVSAVRAYELGGYKPAYPSDHAGYLKIIGNLFINGPALSSKTNVDSQEVTLLIGNWLPHKFVSAPGDNEALVIRDNIFYNNDSYDEIRYEIHSETDKSEIFIQNNYFYELGDGPSGKTIRGTDGICQGTWDWNDIVSSGGWLDDLVTCGIPQANVDKAVNYNALPEINSTTAGPENDKSPVGGSPLIDAAFDSQIRIDKTSNFLDRPVTVTTSSSDEIGPFSFIFSMLTDYYVRPAGGDYGLEDGSSYDNAWAGFSNIDWGVIAPGSTLFIVGIHREQLSIGASGTSADPINIISCTDENNCVTE
jgi:hypothetical protein